MLSCSPPCFPSGICLCHSVFHPRLFATNFCLMLHTQWLFFPKPVNGSILHACAQWVSCCHVHPCAYSHPCLKQTHQYILHCRGIACGCSPAVHMQTCSTFQICARLVKALTVPKEYSPLCTSKVSSCTLPFLSPLSHAHHVSVCTLVHINAPILTPMFHTHCPPLPTFFSCLDVYPSQCNHKQIAQPH